MYKQWLVDVHGTSSSFTNVTCGVPQGSILGPLLFLIYENDMAGAINEKILLYADDTAILVSDNQLMKLKQDLELPLKLSVFGSLIINWLYTLVRLSLFCLGRNENSQTVEICMLYVMGSILNPKLQLNILEPPLPIA